MAHSVYYLIKFVDFVVFVILILHRDIKIPRRAYSCRLNHWLELDSEASLFAHDEGSKLSSSSFEFEFELARTFCR